MTKKKGIPQIAVEELKSILSNAIEYRTLAEQTANIKKNLLLVLSAIAFMLLTLEAYTIEKLFPCIYACVCIILISSQISGLKEKFADVPLLIKIYAFISAYGIYFNTSARNIQISGFQGTVYHIAIVILSLLSFVSIFLLTALFLDWLVRTIRPAFASLSRAEFAVFILLAVILLSFSAYSFFKSNLFWGPPAHCSYDLLYTSDTPSIVAENAYLTLYHTENDLRQPLFSVFAAPVIGAFYAVSLPFSYISPIFTPLFLNTVQILMLLTADLLLAKALASDKLTSICFMVVSAFTYTTLLSSLMMEQYIVGYFYLILAIYSYITHHRASALSITAATGTLLTSALIMPLGYANDTAPSDRVRAAISALERTVLTFVIVLLAFGRFDVVLDLVTRLGILLGFAGGGKSQGCFNQFTAFVSSCFAAPDAAAVTDASGYPTWQLTDRYITDISITGCILLALCIISVIINRKSAITRIAALWTMFSVVLLGIVGWGATENGMILYSLYFCWAYLVLLFQLVKWLSEKLSAKPLTVIASCAAMIVLGIINLNGMEKLLGFAFTEYPFSW